MFFGEEPVDGRKLLRYDYDISYLNSGYLIKTQHGQARVAYHGSVWADPWILQPVLVEINLRFVWPGTAIPNHSIWRRPIPAFLLNGRATIGSSDPSLSTLNATPAASRPSLATPRRRSLKRVDLKISNMFG
jgi:hypothetical protein